MKKKKDIIEFSDEDFFQDDETYHVESSVFSDSKKDTKNNHKDPMEDIINQIIEEKEQMVEEKPPVEEQPPVEEKEEVEETQEEENSDVEKDTPVDEEIKKEKPEDDSTVEVSEDASAEEEKSEVGKEIHEEIPEGEKSEEVSPDELIVKSVDAKDLEVSSQSEEKPPKESIFTKLDKIGKGTRRKIQNIIFKNGYVEFMQLMIIDIIFFVCLLLLGGVLLYSSFSKDGAKIISYKESGNLDYKIYLLPNDFYEEKFLGKDMIYVASLIDHIDISFNYQLASNSNIDMDYSYKILADLEITNKEGARSFFNKQYVLLDTQNLNMVNNNQQGISESVKIDYAHYNSLANKFKASYGLDTDSKLTVYMVITKKNPSSNEYTLNDTKTMSVTIPLSQKAVDIQVPYNEINSSNSILQNNRSVVRHYIPMILSFIFFAASLYSLALIIKKIMLLGPKRSAYDIYVNKILKEYDRLIAESDTLPSFDGKNVIKLRKFTELLDVHDNLQLPIIQYTIAKHHKCYFYISHKDTIYLFVLKAVDLEADQNEKKNK